MMKRKSFASEIWKKHALKRASACLLGVFLLGQPLLAWPVAAQQKGARKRGANLSSLTEDQRITHVIARLSFGARPGDFERVKAMGADVYIARQLEPDSIDDSALDARLSKLPTLTLAQPALTALYNPPKSTSTPTPTPSPAPSPSPSPSPTPSPMLSPAPSSNAKPQPTPVPRNPQQVVTELQRAEVLRATYSARQLNELMVNFWENHFSIYAQKDADRWLLTSFDRDAIRPFALGRFRDLLGATAHSPAMLYYLDNWQSSVVRKYPAVNGKPARQTGGINENYARELMELHTLGVDGGYTQKDVQEVARCFTGWTIQKPNEEGLFVFNPAAHDNGEKIVLGQKIPAGGGIADGERVLDILARHPSTARFISTKLARRFISDAPPASVIERAAGIFLKTGGSIRETLRSIITSPEFNSAAAYRAKTRSPFEFTVAALRALNAETDGNSPLLGWISRMGQPLFGRLTPDGYPDRADQWLSTGALLGRFNFASALVNNKIKGTSVKMSGWLANANSADLHIVTARLVQIALGDDIAPRTRDALDKMIAKAVQQANTAHAVLPDTQAVGALFDKTNTNNTAASNAKSPDPSSDIAQLITLIFGSPEFQRR